MKVGLIVIATHKYSGFVKPLYDSMQKYFLNEPDIERKMFLFTDQPAFDGPMALPVKHEPWPYMTLMRYDIIRKNSNLFYDMDYLYYCDADMVFVGPAGKGILGESVATIHPGYWNSPRDTFPYEKNPVSTAYIPDTQGTHYYIGSFQGGTANWFCNLSEILHHNIRKDLEKGIIAVWHDESHFNKYLAEHPPAVALTPSYSFPEEEWGKNLPFPQILKALAKNHYEIRS